MKIILELSGEHPLIPCEETRCIGTPLLVLPQLVLADCPDPGSVGRLAMTHTVSEFLGQSSASFVDILAMVRSLSITARTTFAVRARKITGSAADVSQQELERLVGGYIGGKVDLQKNNEEYRIIISGSRCLFGRCIFKADPAEYAARRPKSRPFFHPGVMMPKFARALVNLTHLMPGEVLVDPFCGTGGILIEVSLIGGIPVGLDADFLMVGGTWRNCPAARVMRGDATSIPLSDASADAVVTDLPYGQSVIIHGDTLESLYCNALREIARILRPGRTAVVVTHRDIRHIAREILPVQQCYQQRVHKSLTRWILVLRKDP